MIFFLIIKQIKPFQNLILNYNKGNILGSYVLYV